MHHKVSQAMLTCQIQTVVMIRSSFGFIPRMAAKTGKVLRAAGAFAWYDPSERKNRPPNDFKASVSIEPFLDCDPSKLVHVVSPYVTESIWVGPINYIPKNGVSNEDTQQYTEIRRRYEISHLKEVFEGLSRNSRRFGSKTVCLSDLEESRRKFLFLSD